MHWTVTEENIEQAREDCAAIDQRDELAVGCETWEIKTPEGQRGQMTRWPDGRGAICLGGDSQWGNFGGEGGEILFTTDGAYNLRGIRFKKKD
jgi:hypothetical protein